MHYENTPIQIHWKFYHQKMKIFISSTLSSIFFLPFSGRRHKMILKGWRAVKPQHNKKKSSGVLLTIHTFCSQPFHYVWK